MQVESPLVPQGLPGSEAASSHIASSALISRQTKPLAAQSAPFDQLPPLQVKIWLLPVLQADCPSWAAVQGSPGAMPMKTQAASAAPLSWHSKSVRSQLSSRAQRPASQNSRAPLAAQPRTLEAPQRLPMATGGVTHAATPLVSTWQICSHSGQSLESCHTPAVHANNRLLPSQVRGAVPSHATPLAAPPGPTQLAVPSPGSVQSRSGAQLATNCQPAATSQSNS